MFGMFRMESLENVPVSFVISLSINWSACNSARTPVWIFKVGNLEVVTKMYPIPVLFKII
jgi:hypothetical protein